MRGESGEPKVTLITNLPGQPEIPIPSKYTDVDTTPPGASDLKLSN
jgi:hypothetical protein